MGGQQGSIRIIAGAWRRARLSVASRPGLRPTPDRVRETLFNWLMGEIQGACCLDLFAGTGALGFEAASRGARRVVMVERDAQALAALEENRRRLGATQVEIRAADSLSWLQTSDEQFDIVFIDPPFGEYELPDICRSLQRHGHLKPWAKVYLERAASPDLPPAPEGWVTHRSGRAARVRYDLVSPGP